MDAAASAAIALQKAQATQIYAGLGLWPADTLARLVQSQLIEDGTYAGAETIFAATPQFNIDFSPDQLRDPQGRWTTGGEQEPVSNAEGHAPGGEARSRGLTTKRQEPQAPDGTPSLLRPTRKPAATRTLNPTRRMVSKPGLNRFSKGRDPENRWANWRP